MFQPNPPTPKAMPDAELTAKIAELQSQPDGLIAAMSLIEEQSRLRQEDALELSKWQLESQMHLATQPDLPTESAESQSEIDTFLASQDISDSKDSEEVLSTPVVEVEQIAESIKPLSEGSQPVESIDDIVAALNASYAQAATEPNFNTVETIEVFQEVEIVEVIEQAQPLEPKPSFESILQAPVPEPVVSPVLNQSVEALEENPTADKSPDADSEIKAPTGTPWALSWSWLAIASSPLGLVLAGVVHSAGASLAQSILLLATVLVVSSLISSVGSVAAARGSSPLSIVSRAAFGVWGNLLPASLLLVAKVVWTAALVYLTSRIVSPLIFNQPWFPGLAEQFIFPADFTASLFVLLPLIAITSVFSAFGGTVTLRLQQISAVLSVIALGAFGIFVASEYSLQDLDRGEPIVATTLLDLGILTFLLFGFALFAASGETARKLDENTPSSKVFFLSFISTFFLPLLSGTLGLLWLTMAGDTLGSSFTDEVLATIAGAAPVWIFVVFVVGIGVSLVQLTSASFGSSARVLDSILRIPNWASQLIIVILVLATVLVPGYFVAVSVLQESIQELLLLIAVVAAAWTGLLVSDALARTRGYHEVSLTREYGFYGKFNPVNILGFISAVVLGFGYLNGGPQISSWTGYFGDLTPALFEQAGSNIGILMAFGVAMLFPIVFGIPRIRRQEKNLAELDQRRQELKEFLDAAQ